MKPTKKQKLLARQFREAARLVGNSRSDLCGCHATYRVGGDDLRWAFDRILGPFSYCGAYWLGHSATTDEFYRALRSGTLHFRRAKMHRVVGLLLCAEYVLTTKL